jgi:hypothetical protein
MIAIPLILIGAVLLFFVLPVMNLPEATPTPSGLVEANSNYPGQPGVPCMVHVVEATITTASLPQRLDLVFNEGCPVNRILVTGEYPMDARLTIVPLSKSEDGVMLSLGEGQAENLNSTSQSHFRDGVQEWEARPHSANLSSGTVSVFIVDAPETPTWVDGQELVCLVAAEIASDYCN